MAIRTITAARLLLAALMAATCSLAAMAGGGAIGTWKAYMAYHDVQQICAASGNDIFVRASNSLYQYNTADQSITTYDKVSGLSDTYVTTIAWNSSARRLVVVYDNSNIDLLETDGDVTNVPDLYLRTMTYDKTVNSISMDGRHAYLATNFGVVKLDASTGEISESYVFGVAISRVALSGGSIYARAASGQVWVGDTRLNLIDTGNWQTTSSYPSGIFDTDNSDYDTYLPVVQTLQTGGPQNNNIGFLKMHRGKLYTCNGYVPSINTACIQVLDNGQWTMFENDITDRTGHRFQALYSLDIDPQDESHVFAGGQTGLYEFRNGMFVQEYTIDNSPLESAATVNAGNKDYVIVSTVLYDDLQNLWVANSIAPNGSLYSLSPSGQWQSHHNSDMLLTVNNNTCSLENMSSMMIDSRGIMWFANNFYREPALIRHQMSQDTTVVYSSDLQNQDGTSLTLNYVKDICEDREGNLWFCTDLGPLYITPQQILSGEHINVFNQYKVARNDGSGLADYLFDNIQISAMAIDGANRKWLGTDGNGLYLISADNNEQVQHFTTENSGLISDNIIDIEIDHESGEVFLATSRGLCSYMADVTTPVEEMDKDNIYAYPNPVRPGYTGLITVVGLSFDADVKVTTATGYLVAEGRSNGGTFTWDGRDRHGHRVASGVYNVVTAKSDGSKGTVCKVAIVN